MIYPSILRYRLVFAINCLPDLAACTTHIIKLHASFGGSLLRLKEDSFLLLAGGTLSLNSRQRWILGDVLGDAAGGTDCVAELVAEDAGGFSWLFECACSAGELEGVGIVVFGGVEHVGAFSTEAECNLCGLFLFLCSRTRHDCGVCG